MSTITTIRKGIRGADEIADLIKNPNPDKPFSNAIGNAGRRMCDGWSSVQPWTEGFVGGALPGPLAGSALLNLVCKPYLDDQGYDPPVIESPFTGGQCDCDIYRVQFTLRTAEGAGISNFDFFARGPLLGFSIVQGVPASPGASVETDLRLNCRGLGTGGGCQAQAVRTFNQSSQQVGVVIANIVISADPSGQDCGNPPGIPAPGPNPAPSPGPFPPGEDPGVDPDGNPFFYVPDIDDPFGDIPIGDDPFAPATPPGAGSGGDGLPGDPEAIGAEAGEVTGGEDGEDIDFGEPPEGRVWIGCIVETTSVSNLGGIPGTGPQSKVWPTVRANAALNYGSKKGTNNRINSQFHDLIRSATSLIVTGVFLQVQPGSTSKVFPLSALKCPENPCEEE